MSSFVQHPKECFVEESRVIPRRDAAIAGAETRTERVSRGVEPTGGEVEADRCCSGLREHLLPVDRVFPGENARVGLPGRGNNLLYKRREFGRQVGEERF